MTESLPGMARAFSATYFFEPAGLPRSGDRLSGGLGGTVIRWAGFGQVVRVGRGLVVSGREPRHMGRSR